MINNAPNFLMIDERQESPEEIIQDYMEIIHEVYDDKDALSGVLWEFFDDINYWTLRQVFIDQAKLQLSHLEQLDKLEHEFIDDSFDDEFE